MRAKRKPLDRERQILTTLSPTPTDTSTQCTGAHRPATPCPESTASWPLSLQLPSSLLRRRSPAAGPRMSPSRPPPQLPHRAHNDQSCCERPIRATGPSEFPKTTRQSRVRKYVKSLPLRISCSLYGDAVVLLYPPRCDEPRHLGQLV